MKKITLDFLVKTGACESAITQYKLETKYDLKTIFNRCKELNQYEWAYWLITRIMNKKQKIQYAVFAAEQVIDIYEKKYPSDNRPRNAINCAKKCINNNIKKNRTAAYAASAAYATAASASAAYDAAKVAIQIKIFNYGLELIGLKIRF